MTKEFLFDFMRQHKLGVLSTVAGDGRPESALVGIAVSEGLEIVFDTVKASRKYKNLLQNPMVALVIGWDDETTVQFEGIATELVGPEDDRYREIYYDAYPDGRDRAANWAGLVHFKVTPKWLRYSNFNNPVVVEELVF
ncbi:MAG TPA: pyridoxamine 5'-phosphate oxidase family protein [Mucilaginibacter sp.]|jgi:pyridoxine/pyridoxamine 5'-phosphate oxidase|nr:pyridoxamine 5'-phosphate oxidase family protein [Mucilaginibacter sp.]